LRTYPALTKFLILIVLAPACGGRGGGRGNPAPPVLSAGQLAPLSYRIEDAEYSAALHRIVAVSKAPDRLRLLNPDTGAETSIALPLAPAGVGLSPDGLKAYVGHAGWMTVLDLSPLQVQRTVAVSGDALDIVAAGNGFAYFFPKRDQWEHVRCIDLTTDTETLHTGSMIYEGTRALLHPSGSFVYGGGPFGLEKYSIAAGTLSYLYDAPATPPNAGGAWLSEDGERIFTYPGNVFRAHSDPAQDLASLGALAGVSSIQTLAESEEAGQVALVPAGTANEDTEIRIHDSASFALIRRFSLPTWLVNGTPAATRGRHLFFNPQGTVLYAVVRCGVQKGMWADGIVRYPAGFQGTALAPPTGVSVKGNGTIAELSWAPSAGATGYTVYRGTAAGVTRTSYAQSYPGSVSPLSINGLALGVPHYFVVTAGSPGGESAESVEVSMTLQSGVFPPPPPSGVTGTAGDGQVTLTWSPPPAGVVVTAYLLRDIGITPSVWEERRVGITSPFTWTGLQNGAWLQIILTSTNSSGEGGSTWAGEFTPRETVQPALVPLAHRVADAEFSPALGRIVTAALGENRLYLVHPETGAQTAVNLNHAPTCVGVSPNGLEAIVGHASFLSYVNLSTPALIKTIAIPVAAADVVLAGNGYAYVLAASSSAERVRCVNLTTESTTLSTGNFILGGGRGAQRPGTLTLYTNDTLGSPSATRKFDLTPGVANYLSTSPYWGTYPNFGDLWFLEGGARMITNGGTCFRAAAAQPPDMDFGGNLEVGVSLIALTHSAEAGRIAVIPAAAGSTPFTDKEVLWYKDAYLNFQRSRAIPSFPGPFAAHGKFAFFNASGSRLHVVVQADAAAGLANDYALVSYDP